jgi:hypothetical protein
MNSLAEFVLVLAMASTALLVHAQDPASAAQGSERVSLLTMSGSVMQQGQNATPVGRWRLKTFRIEELNLPRSKTVHVRGHAIVSDKAWRVTITGGPFPAGDQEVIIWAGDIPLGDAQESPNLHAVTAITYDRDALLNADRLYFSYGREKGSRIALPEKLALKDALLSESAP